MASNSFTRALRAGDVDGFFAAAAALREAMGKKGLIADRSYRLKKYPACFTGTQLADYIAKAECIPRSEAVVVGYVLVMYGVIHHVVDDHMFKDEGLFFRFRQDDGTFKASTRSYRLWLRKAMHIYACMHASGTMIRTRTWGKRPYPNSFVNREFFPWLMMQELVTNHSEALEMSRALQEHGFIRHVTNDHVINDDNYFYFRFELDQLSKPKGFTTLFGSHEGGLFTGVIDNTLRVLQQGVRAALRRQSEQARDLLSTYTVMRRQSAGELRKLERNVDSLALGDDFRVQSAKTKKSKSKRLVNDDAAAAIMADLRAQFKEIQHFKGSMSEEEADRLLEEAGMVDGEWIIYEHHGGDMLEDCESCFVLACSFKDETWHTPIECIVIVPDRRDSTASALGASTGSDASSSGSDSDSDDAFSPARVKTLTAALSIGASKYFTTAREFVDYLTCPEPPAQVPCALKLEVSPFD